MKNRVVKMEQVGEVYIAILEYPIESKGYFSTHVLFDEYGEVPFIPIMDAKKGIGFSIRDVGEKDLINKTFEFV